jgi:hypothetical protein
VTGSPRHQATHVFPQAVAEHLGSRGHAGRVPQSGGSRNRNATRPARELQRADRGKPPRAWTARGGLR